MADYFWKEMPTPKMPNHIKYAMQPQALSSHVGGFLSLILLSGMLLGCESATKENSADGNTPKPAEENASITITNQLEVDPGPLTFHLFSSLASDPLPSFHKHKVGAVEYGKAKTLTVPAGKWKLAYSKGGGDYSPMPPGEEELGGNVWPTKEFKQNGTYILKLHTDEGGVEIWTFNF